MNRSTLGSIAAIALLTAAGAANADIVATALVTADNHYALYTGDPSSVSYIGRNELSGGGAPGQYNWSQPELHTFTSGQFIYIAAWSDNSTAQGLLASISLSNGDTANSGDSRWQVYRSNQDLGGNAAAPTNSTVQTWIADATTNNLWETPHIGGANGIAPWGTVPGIGSVPRWMWTMVPGDNDPLVGGSGYGETLLFRMAVPTPGAAGLMAMGGLLASRRRRA
jgi:hypothetical protein